jgi:hypothetical protein
MQPDDIAIEPAPSASELGITSAEKPLAESLVRPHETRAMPGYGGWLEGVMGRPALPADGR